MPETAFDSVAEHCRILIQQKYALLDGLNRLSNVLQGPANVTKQELMNIITTALKNCALIE